MNEVEFNDWKLHPVTKEFFKFLERERRERMTIWSKGGFNGDSIETTGLRNTEQVSVLIGIAVAQNVEYAQLQIKDDEDEA